MGQRTITCDGFPNRKSEKVALIFCGRLGIADSAGWEQLFHFSRECFAPFLALRGHHPAPLGDFAQRRVAHLTSLESLMASETKDGPTKSYFERYKNALMSCLCTMPGGYRPEDLFSSLACNIAQTETVQRIATISEVRLFVLFFFGFF